MAALIIKCQKINRMLGTNLGPWDLEKLSEEWCSALEMWADELPKAQAWQAESQAALDRVRNRKQVQ
jgi:hypothetical protein